MAEVFKAREVFTRQRLKPPKPKAWSHMDDLKALKGKKICLLFSNEEYVTGVLLEADQFTIQLFNEYNKSISTYFKGHIRSFEAVMAA